MDDEFRYRLLKSISEKGISASELSKRSGVGKSDISNYINGKYVAKQDKCYALATALDVDPGWLMTGEEPTTRNIIANAFREAMEKKEREEAAATGAEVPRTIEARVIAQGIDQLPQAQREQALAMIRIMFTEHADLFREEK